MSALQMAIAIAIQRQDDSEMHLIGTL